MQQMCNFKNGQQLQQNYREKAYMLAMGLITSVLDGTPSESRIHGSGYGWSVTGSGKSQGNLGILL